MTKTKTGIEMPDENDSYHGFQEALHILWTICRQIGDVLDKQQEEIDKLKECIMKPNDYE